MSKNNGLEPMSLQEIQNVSLEILKHVHRFCVENEIQYSLAFGTLIGCIRHHGFIPWDDDLDIMMTRENYEKFCKLYHDTEDYVLISPQKRNAYIAYSRVCDMKHTFVEPKSPTHTIPTGVWIDIFVLYDVDNDEQAFYRKLDDIHSIARRIYRQRMIRRPLSAIKGLKNKAKTLFRKLFCQVDILKLVDKHVYMCENFVDKNTDYYGNLGWCLKLPIARRGRFPKKMFEEYVLREFSNSEFYVIKGYDEFLRHYYGDYLQLPPLHEQVRGHTFHKYYWKDNRRNNNQYM